MEWCNCGHNPPVVLEPTGARFLSVEPNTPLGVCMGWNFVGEHINDIRGVPMLLYTDGLNEAENIRHEQFGNDRMLRQAACTPFTTAAELIFSMQRAVEQFVDGAEASDDLTMLCLKIR